MACNSLLLLKHASSVVISVILDVFVLPAPLNVCVKCRKRVYFANVNRTPHSVTPAAFNGHALFALALVSAGVLSDLLWLVFV